MKKSTYSFTNLKNTITLSGPLATDKEKILSWYRTLPSNSVTFSTINSDGNAGWLPNGGNRFVIVFKSSNNYGAILIMSYWSVDNKLGYAVIENGVVSDRFEFATK